MKEGTFFPWICGVITGALMLSFITPACANDNDRFTNPPIAKVVVRKDRDTKKVNKFIQVDEQVWVPVDGKGFSTNQEGGFYNER